MNTDKYDLFIQAIKEKKQAKFIYHGKTRAICPHILGHKKDKEQALVCQLYAGSNSKITSWKCMTIDEMKDISLNDGQWFTEPAKGKTSCVDRCQG